MANIQLILLGAAILATSTSGALAGPCSSTIDQVQARIDAKLDAKAAAGPSAKESTDALAHRQPTPNSIAGAEEKLRDVQSQNVATIKQAMERARAQDNAGEGKACEQTLAEVQRLIGP